MRKELICEIIRKVKIDEQFFGDGFLDSWSDFASFKRAYEEEVWSEEESSMLQLYFLMHRLRIGNADLVLSEICA